VVRVRKHADLIETGAYMHGWDLICGWGSRNRGAENSTAEGTLGTPFPTDFLIEFVQISGVHLIVAGGSGPLDPPASYAAGLRLHIAGLNEGPN
jgi:hypothetical protein